MKSLLPLLALAMPLAACAGPARVKAVSAADREARAAVAAQVRRCYRNPRVPMAGKRIVTRLFVRYGPDGALLGLPLLAWQDGLSAETRPYSSRMAEAAKMAVVRCNPVRIPATGGRRESSEFLLTFSPQMSA
jgi:hypothetical protein